MKKVCFSILFFLLGFAVVAQDDNDKKEDKSNSGEYQTLFQNVGKISGFGGFDMEYAPIDGNVGVFTGGSGGVMLGNLYFGGYGTGLSTSMDVNGSRGNERLRFSHGGFMVGADLMPKRLIHFTVGTKLGWGNVRIGEEGYVGDPGEWFGNAGENVFVLQPSAGIEVNMTKFMKIALTGKYRLVQGADDLEGFDANKLNNASVGLSFKFGWFN